MSQRPGLLSRTPGAERAGRRVPPADLGAALTETGTPVEPAAEADDGRLRLRTLTLRVLAIATLIVLVVWANLYAAENDFVREAARAFGYPGILAAAAASGFNLVVPVPIIAFFPFFMEIGFDRYLTVGIIALGMTLGDLIGYLIGRTTRDAFAPRARGLLARLERLRERRPWLPFVVMLLYAAFAPIPNEVLVIPLAFIRYPLGLIFLAVLIGNTVFNSLVAFGVVRVFGIF